jgi:transposase InsO family protein
MTVGELKKLLEGLPDDALVLCPREDWRYDAARGRVAYTERVGLAYELRNDGCRETRRIARALVIETALRL